MTRKSRRELENAVADLDDDEDDEAVTFDVLVIDWMDDYPSSEDFDGEAEIVVDFINVDT